MTQDNGAKALPFDVNHISVVVEDLEKTREFLSSTWGLGPWKTRVDLATKEDMTVGEPLRIRLSWTKLGPILFELIQPLEARSVWGEFLKTNGEGLHHIAFIASNYDEMVLKLQQQGSSMIVGGIFEGIRWGYFKTKPGGIIVEIEEREEIPW
ncbi:VOC family protein [Chloroflexota bacterium]